MSRLPVVVVLGRPNVGKSTLINRILRRRAAVVEEKPGVTRDRKEFEAEFGGVKFLLVDTGGWEVSPDGELTMGIKDQAEIGLAGADAVVFVADSRSSLTDDDAGVARLLHEADVPFLLVANKVDSPQVEPELDHLWSLGLGEPRPISALNGYRVAELLEDLVGLLPHQVGPVDDESRIPTLAIIGRPNVGKSTLLNKLVGERRVLVSPVPGTTRDAIDVAVEMDGQPFRVVDTAGIRRATKVSESTEFYSVLRARKSIDEADVVLFTLDAHDGATHQEQRLAEEIVERGAGLVILLNKWDDVTQGEKDWAMDSVGDRLGFVGWAPVLRVSAKTGARLHRLAGATRTSLTNRARRIPTPELNRKIRAWQEAHPPPTRKGRRGHIIYAVQAGTEPPVVVTFVRGGLLGPDYLRFIEKRLREEYDFIGTPVQVVARRRSRKAANV